MSVCVYEVERNGENHKLRDDGTERVQTEAERSQIGESNADKLQFAKT